MTNNNLTNNNRIDDNPYHDFYGIVDGSNFDGTIPLAPDLDPSRCILEWDPVPEMFGGCQIYFAYVSPIGRYHGRSVTPEGACRTLRYLQNFWTWIKATGRSSYYSEEDKEEFHKTPGAQEWLTWWQSIEVY